MERLTFHEQQQIEDTLTALGGCWSVNDYKGAQRVMERFLREIQAEALASRAVPSTGEAERMMCPFDDAPCLSACFLATSDPPAPAASPTYGNGLCACGHLSNDHACDHEASDMSCFKCECEAFRRPPAPAASSGAAVTRNRSGFRECPECGVVLPCHVHTQFNAPPERPTPAATEPEHKPVDLMDALRRALPKE